MKKLFLSLIDHLVLNTDEYRTLVPVSLSLLAMLFGSAFYVPTVFLISLFIGGSALLEFVHATASYFFEKTRMHQLESAMRTHMYLDFLKHNSDFAGLYFAPELIETKLTSKKQAFTDPSSVPEKNKNDSVVQKKTTNGAYDDIREDFLILKKYQEKEEFSFAFSTFSSILELLTRILAELSDETTRTHSRLLLTRQISNTFTSACEKYYRIASANVRSEIIESGSTLQSVFDNGSDALKRLLAKILEERQENLALELKHLEENVLANTEFVEHCGLKESARRGEVAG